MLIPRTGGRGILRGKSGDNSYRCNIEYLARGETVQEGDAGRHQRRRAARSRATSPSGTSRRVVPGAVGLYQEVEVTPDVDFARLSDVLVVVAPPPAPDPDPRALTTRPRAG